MSRIRISTAAVLVAGSFAVSAQAQSWPEGPVTMIVAFGAGGGTDTIARMVAEPLAEVLGQPVVVENRPGAGGTIGADAAAKAAPDGRTMYMMANGHTVAAAMYETLPYDPVGDYQGISEVAAMPLVVVARPDFPADNLEELLEIAAERPGELNYASVGVGSSQHFAGALLSQSTGADMFHIPYQNTPEALAAILSGEVDLLVEVMAPMLGQIEGGDIKAIVKTSAERHPNLPEVGTVAEAGFEGFDVSTWYGLTFPAGTDPAIVEAANSAVHEVLEMDALRDRLMASGFLPSPSTPEEFTAKIGSEVERWIGVRESAGIEQR
ncbi:Bug family tripartite tricarboxylate transporter substrate binding protein [Alkalilacustris brevis]|uniref:Bug family tripartite tricarboxylate transporter substrate binding protein n=1 Tax=Alkalilacustris brevis TaxID=2026338 RepID=UPI000E0D7AC5|nr:tripartite tricarboxylate transporter substrate binding protein [Alkalilacustris brevis]